MLHSGFQVMQSASLHAITKPQARTKHTCTMGMEHKGDEIGTGILGKVFEHALVLLIRADVKLKEAAETECLQHTVAMGRADLS